MKMGRMVCLFAACSLVLLWQTPDAQAQQRASDVKATVLTTTDGDSTTNQIRQNSCTANPQIMAMAPAASLPSIEQFLKEHGFRATDIEDVLSLWVPEIALEQYGDNTWLAADGNRFVASLEHWAVVQNEDASNTEITFDLTLLELDFKQLSLPSLITNSVINLPLKGRLYVSNRTTLKLSLSVDPAFNQYGLYPPMWQTIDFGNHLAMQNGECRCCTSDRTARTHCEQRDCDRRAACGADPAMGGSCQDHFNGGEGSVFFTGPALGVMMAGLCALWSRWRQT
jgi:hypothetical protein